MDTEAGAPGDVAAWWPGDVRSATLLDTRTYPEISFTGTAPRADGDDWVVDGSVTAHGVTQPVPVRVSGARADGDLIRFRATARLDRGSFGITRKKGMVGQAVTVTIAADAWVLTPGGSRGE